MFLGVDIGGANIKASLLNVDDFFELKSVKVHYPLWIKGVAELPKAVEAALKLLGCERIEGVALTMTAELSDVFKNKVEGVKEVVSRAKQAFGDFKVVTSRGELLSPDEAVDRYMEVAAANWWCVGWLASLLEDNCVVVDVGSTTTTITPVVNGKVAAKGLNDVEKMILGEIVYVGSLRTSIPSITSMVPLGGSWCRVSSEHFSNTGDVNLILGLLEEKDYDVATPDGRGRSFEECHDRLSRIVCGDGVMIKPAQVRVVANFIYNKVVEKVFDGLLQVLSRLALEDCLLNVGFAAGLGDFIALEALRRAGLNGVAMKNLIGRDNSIALTSASLAIYLAYDMGVDVKRWISSLR